MKFIENSNVELKEEFTAEIKKEVIAFANTQGGIIYIGIANNGHVIGVEKQDNALLQAVNSIRDSIKPDITLFTECTIETIDNEKVIKISVQRGSDRPYYLKDKGLKPSGVYVRQGSASVPASQDAIRQMIKETDGDTFEKVRSINQDLTFEYTKIEMEKRNIEFGTTQMNTLGLIENNGLYTNLGLLLSDQCVHSVKVAFFEGSNKNIFKDRREFRGSLLKQLVDIYEYIDLYNKTKATFSGLDRIDKRDYPQEAIREALLNAIIHREYSFSGSTLINIFDDRIEFVSLGGLVPGLSLDAIMLGVSQSRNERLANVFYRLKLIEAYGTGITKIMASYCDSTLKPVIKSVNGAFQVVLPNQNYISSEIKSNEKSGLYKVEANSQYQKILAAIGEHGSIKRYQVQSLLGVGQSRALKILNEMADIGVITSKGKGKTTEYHRR